jgi:predicted Zn-dependent protease
VRLREALGLPLIATLLLSACAARPAPAGTESRPLSPAPAERALWAEAEREAASLLERVRRYEDAGLDAYLASLVRRLTTDAARAAGGAPVRVGVLRDPTLNAFALPDGHVFVHTGLLAAVESEAQLALILGREIAHVTGRHALAAARDGRLIAPRHEGARPLGPTAAAILGTGARLAALAALSGHGERLERRADRVALTALQLAGWDSAEAIEVYGVLARRAVEGGAVESFLLGRPDWLLARHRLAGARLRPGAAAPTGPGEDGGLHAYRLVVALENAAEDIRVGRLPLAARQLSRVLQAAPGDVTAHVYAGEVHRLLAQQAGSREARQAAVAQAERHYGRALALDPTRADVHRQLGLLFYQERDTARASAELQQYLRLAPGAPDAGRVAEYVRVLQP